MRLYDPFTSEHSGHMPPMVAKDEDPAGYVEYEARTAIRALCRLYGAGGAKRLAFKYIRDEAERQSK